MSNCITVQDILDFPACCNISENLCCPFEAIEAELCSVIELVENITGTTVCPYQGCKAFDGCGGKKLYFNPCTSDKLLEFESIETSSCCDSGCQVNEEPSNCGNWLEYKCSGIFKKGSKNIIICGTWGSYETLPLGLKKAIIQLTLENLQPGLIGLETSQGLVDSVSWDDFSINYNTADVDLNVPSTGYSSIDRIIQAYTPTTSQIKFGVIDGGPSSLCVHNIFRNECSRCQ